MRDAHRLKEKYDLSLDNRQIVSLVIGGLVVLGAAFVLGVVVGKKLSGDGPGASAPDLLSALDAKAATPLTFHEELTQKAPAAPTPTPVPTAPPPPAAPAPIAAAPAPESPSPKTEEPDEAAASPVRAGGLTEAIARAQRAPEPAQTGSFSLQLSASQDRSEAERLVAKLQDQGFSPFILTAEVPGRGTWYRVRLGAFASKDAASKYLKDFRRETQYEAFVAEK